MADREAFQRREGDIFQPPVRARGAFSETCLRICDSMGTDETL